jgi:hypothetical protein
MSVIENSKVDNQEGVYRHPETGAEVSIKAHAKLGTAMADGFVAAGFVFDRSLDDDPKAKARGDRREAAQEEETQKNPETETETGAPAPTGKPLNEYKLKELVEIAKKVGVENADEFTKPGTSKETVIAAIEAAQEEGNE